MTKTAMDLEQLPFRIYLVDGEYIKFFINHAMLCGTLFEIYIGLAGLIVSEFSYHFLLTA